MLPYDLLDSPVGPAVAESDYPAGRCRGLWLLKVLITFVAALSAGVPGFFSVSEPEQKIWVGKTQR